VLHLQGFDVAGSSELLLQDSSGNQYLSSFNTGKFNMKSNDNINDIDITDVKTLSTCFPFSQIAQS
jgi:hypothetical protein